MASLFDRGAESRRAARIRDWCPTCGEQQPFLSQEDCPVCGTILTMVPEAPQTPNVNSEATLSSLLQIESEQLRHALETSMNTASQHSNRRGVSKKFMESLPRVTVDANTRCSLLQEVVLEVVHCEDEMGQGEQQRQGEKSAGGDHKALDDDDMDTMEMDGSSGGRVKPDVRRKKKRIFFETEVGAFSPLPVLNKAGGSSATSHPIVFCNPSMAESTLLNASDLTSSLAVVNRGAITFVQKALRLQAAGAAGVVVVQMAPVWPYTMRDTKGEAMDSRGALAVPVVMIRKEDGDKLRSLKQGPSALRGCLHVKPLETSCPVCQEEYAPGHIATRLPCRHVFHEHCISLWFKKHNTCPNCRFEMPTDDEEYEVARFEEARDQARDSTWRSWFV